MSTRSLAAPAVAPGWWEHLGPGLLLAAAVAAAAALIDALERRLFGQPILEALVAAIILGMLVRNLARLPAGVEPGASYAAKQLLELGVLLLGATLDVRQALA